MEQKTQGKIDELRSSSRIFLEKAQEAVCGICHYPYIETDREAMMDRCDCCPVMQALDHQWENAFLMGRATGMIESVMIAVDSAQRMQDGWAERTVRK